MARRRRVQSCGGDIGRPAIARYGFRPADQSRRRVLVGAPRTGGRRGRVGARSGEWRAGRSVKFSVAVRGQRRVYSQARSDPDAAELRTGGTDVTPSRPPRLWTDDTASNNPQHPVFRRVGFGDHPGVIRPGSTGPRSTAAATLMVAPAPTRAAHVDGYRSTSASSVTSRRSTRWPETASSSALMSSYVRATPSRSTKATAPSVVVPSASTRWARSIAAAGVSRREGRESKESPPEKLGGGPSS